jgi:hypothetical protein
MGIARIYTPFKLLFLCAISASLLMGCFAPLLVPMMVASTGKFIQTTTGGSMSVNFDEASITPEAKSLLKSSKRVGVWFSEGDNEALAGLADTLDSKGLFEVVGPATMAGFIKKAEVPGNLPIMTRAEIQNSFVKVCGLSGVDTLVAIKITGGDLKGNFWSVERGKSTSEYSTILFDCKSKMQMKDIKGAIVVEQGATMPNMAEIKKIAGQQLGEKLAEMAGAPPVAKETAVKK